MDCYKGFFVATALCVISVVSADQLPLPYATSYDNSDNSLTQDLQEAESVPGSYVQHYDKGPDGYKVQSGFEGYIIPAKAHKLAHIKEVKEGIIHHFLGFFEPLISVGIAVLPKLGVALVGVLALVFIGTLASTLVCAYTSICHMTFMGLDLTHEEVRGLVNQKNLREAARFVRAAVKKYHEINAQSSDEAQKVVKNLVK